LASYLDLFKPTFGRREQFEGFSVYGKGLLSDLAGQTLEGIALAFGEKGRDLQPFAGQSPWEREPRVTAHQQLVGAPLGEVDGVALVDESGLVKQGEACVGVGPQDCGSLGKVANSQNGG